MRLNHGYLKLAFLLGSLASCIAAAASGPIPQPAVWMPHDLIVPLENLPKRYSCNDLWYKFRDVLRAIGARPDLQILAYRCEKGLGDTARSPRVHLQFQLPQVVHGKDTQWSDVRAVTTIVRLEPGQPASLDASDCELLRQIKQTLIENLSDRVVAYDLACSAPPTAHPHFSLTVEALTPATDGQRRVASRVDPAPISAGPVSPGSARAPGHADSQ
jgi:hypothetical protein